jgi:hypothetical protein
MRALPLPTWFLLCLLGLAPTARAQGAGPAPSGDCTPALERLGLENVAGADSGRVGYENRRYRRSVEALDRVERALGGPVTVYEKRYGLTAACFREVEEPGADLIFVEPSPGSPSPSFATIRAVPSPPRRTFEVRYPFEREFPREPGWTPQRPTWRSLDLVLGLLFDYELGRIYSPFLYRVQLQPMLRYTPWPGGLLRAAIVLPVRDRFKDDPFMPDAGLVRPGPLAFEQFAWVPGTGLLSADAGYFGDNRYGTSVGLARPLAGGRFVADVQADVTGFLAFGPGGTEYSSPSHWTGFGALTWRPGLDVAVRARAARFLYGDNGVELEVRRAFHEAEIAFFGEHSSADDAVGVRLVLPVPPMTRAAGAPLRVQAVERWAISYYSRSVPVGRDLAGVASRTEYLRQLDVPTLGADRERREGATGLAPGPAPAHKDEYPPDLINLTGVTGFVNTPWAGVLTDRRLEAGYSHIPRRWTYDHRGHNDNEAYYLSLGFLPRAEASIRWTVIPGLRSFEDQVPDSRLTDTDYMASGRLCLVPPAWNRPGLSVGVEDARGTRRFHSTYAVAGMPWHVVSLHGRATMGYAFDVLEATRRTLLGTFGAVEISPVCLVAAQVEYDTEKWNLGLAVPAPYGLRLRAAWLNLRSLSVGVGFGLSL